MLLSSRKDMNVCLNNLRSSEISEIKGCFEPLVYMVIRKFSSLAYRQDDAKQGLFSLIRKQKKQHIHERNFCSIYFGF